MNINLLGAFCLSLLVLGLPGMGAETSVTGYIGSHKLTFSASQIGNSADFPINAPADYAAVTEVFPDTSKPVTYSYRVMAGDVTLYDRVYTSPGFGKQTYFVRMPKGRVDSIRVVNTSKSAPVLIASVSGLTQSELDVLLKSDSFRLMGLIPPTVSQEKACELIAELAANLGQKPEYGISRGFSYEVQFASAQANRVREQFETCLKWSSEHNLPAMLGLVSWWSGTPRRVPDGLGGMFDDMKYQQVCYSPDVEVPENPELKAFVGERYNLHYGLTVPNHWSCPWLTMNSDHFNQYRCKRLVEAAALLREVCGGDCSWIDSLYLDNEPRYWDTECEAGNPKAGRQGRTVWADFNPLVIEAARRDGVDLNPNDGLSNEELAWLHRNVGRYNQLMVDGVRKALWPHSLIRDMPVYTHTLQHKHSFPGGDIGHPLSEWGYADGARTGIEGMWTMPWDFYRVREWGKWSNLNREECDGQDIATHLWDLRVSYMMGADLYNSYNWQAIGSQRFFDYVKEFLDSLPVATAPAASVKVINNDTIRLRTPMKLQAFTGLRVRAEVSRAVKGRAVLTVTAADGRVYSSDVSRIDLGEGETVLNSSFTTPAESKSDADAIVKLRVYDENGNVSDAVRFVPGSEGQVGLSLDLRAQRGLSLWVISRSGRD